VRRFNDLRLKLQLEISCDSFRSKYTIFFSDTASPETTRTRTREDADYKLNWTHKASKVGPEIIQLTALMFIR
jgi:hypothetical protein